MQTYFGELISIFQYLANVQYITHYRLPCGYITFIFLVQLC